MGYSALNMYQFYTVLLSFIIFRQLYAPMNPLWHIRQRYWHLIIWILIIALDIVSIVLSSHGGVYPMGACLPGPSVKWELFSLVNLPFMTSCTLCVILLIASSFLLHKELHKQKDVTSQTDRIEDLLFRLILYSIGEIACLILLCVTGLAFFVQHDALSEGMNASIQCQLEQMMSGKEFCPEREAKMSPFFFVSWVLAALFGTSAQLILSCHREARERIKRVSTFVAMSKTKSTGQSNDSGSSGEKKKILLDKTETTTSSQQNGIARAETDDEFEEEVSKVPNAFDKKSQGVISITPSDVGHRLTATRNVVSPTQDIELEVVDEHEENADLFDVDSGKSTQL